MSEPAFLSPEKARETARRVASYRTSIRLQSQRADQIPQMLTSGGHSILNKLIGMAEGLIAGFLARNGIAPRDSVQVRNDEQLKRFDPVGEGSGHSVSPDLVSSLNPIDAAEAAHRLSETSR